MNKNIFRAQKLNRVTLKEIKGGGKVIVPNCYTLCGEAGGVVSNHPGIGDMCTPDRSLCCYCR
ncbi:hypothetical protein H5J24_13670 [Chryseobacterium capnotolerans]|uniref:hypothetical protein n=1 Tax=Chryseobacterium TaxID=59732 RepID=UPI000A76B865|nr:MULTISPECIES: hypothetical protein [Chryseobacterium]UHO36852.1 hypothetical protein H5J24_13670 [Chryseobacterium capnotolerans]